MNSAVTISCPSTSSVSEQLLHGDTMNLPKQLWLLDSGEKNPNPERSSKERYSTVALCELNALWVFRSDRTSLIPRYGLTQQKNNTSFISVFTPPNTNELHRRRLIT